MIKRIFLCLLLGILITWSVISVVLIFHVMGIDQIYTKIRITKDLESIKENRYSRPVMVFKGRLAANSENEINLSAIKSCLEDGVRDELKDLFMQRPYIIVEHASSSMNLECYKTVRVSFYIADSLRPGVALEQAYDKVTAFLNRKLDEVFTIEKDFFKLLPEMTLKTNQLSFLKPGTNLKFPESIKINGNDVLLTREIHGDVSYRLFRGYADTWNVEYNYASVKLTGFKENQDSNKENILQIPVKDAQGEIYQILVRLK